MAAIGGVSSSSNVSPAYVTQMLAADASRKTMSTERIQPVPEAASTAFTPQTSSWAFDPEKLDIYM